MSAEAWKYRALPGQSRRYLGADLSIHRLFLGPDHLLSVVRTLAVSEVYKRFYLKDIQAVAITRTNSGKIATAVLGIIAGLSVLAVLAGTVWQHWEYSLVVLAGSPALLSAILLAGNLIAGPTCRFQINTAIQVEHLYGVGRLRAAHELLGILQPLIEQAQGPLALADLDPADPGLVDARVSARVNPIAAPAGKAGPLKSEKGNYHLGLFIILLLFGVSNAIDIFWQHETKNMIDSILVLPFILFFIAAVVRQRGSDLAAGVRNIVWGALVYLFIHLIISSILSIGNFIQHPDMLEGVMKGDVLKLRMDGPEFVVFFAAAAVASSALGLLGITRLSAFRARPSGPASSAPAPPLSPPGGGDGA